LIAGQLPRRVFALVREWRELHVDELKRDWELVEQRQRPNEIEPLE
jgi:hypothetical protein